MIAFRVSALFWMVSHERGEPEPFVERRVRRVCGAADGAVGVADEIAERLGEAFDVADGREGEPSGGRRESLRIPAGSHDATIRGASAQESRLVGAPAEAALDALDLDRAAVRLTGADAGEDRRADGPVGVGEEHP